MISFQTDGVEMPCLDKAQVRAWIEAVVATYGRTVGPLGYVFCDDAKILEVNNRFLSHDYYTDIITFDYCHGQVVSGDMYISLDTVRTNAEQFVGTFDNTRFSSAYVSELHRVVIHGVLHLCGINDKGPGEREIMEQHENRALALFPTISK